MNGLGFAQEGFLPAREPEATSTTYLITMQPSEQLIDALVSLESKLAFSDCKVGIFGPLVFQFHDEMRKPGGIRPLVIFALESTDNGEQEAALRVIRAVLDTYAPRRCALDFDGPDLKEPERMRTFRHTFHPSGGPTQSVTSDQQTVESADETELRHLRRLVAVIEDFVPAINLTEVKA